MNRTSDRPGGGRPRQSHGVAITGIAISCAVGTGTEEVWKAIRDGQSGIGLFEVYNLQNP